MNVMPTLDACSRSYILKQDSLQKGSEIQKGNCIHKLHLFPEHKLFGKEA